MTAWIPVVKPNIGLQETLAVNRVLESGMLAQGDEVSLFENEFSKLVSKTFCVAVNSGTSAIHLSLLALGIGRGDEVIVPSFTFVSTASAFLMHGAKPVFVDVDEATLNIDARNIEAAITPRTRAVCVVHYAGIAVDLDAIQSICDKNGIVLIEDNAHGFGAEYAGEPLGTLGNFGIVSPRKVLDIRNGGILYSTCEQPAFTALPPAPGAMRWYQKRAIKQLLALYPALGQRLKRKPDYLSAYEGREPTDAVQLYEPDAAALGKIKTWDSSRERVRRQACWHIWHRWVTINNLEPLAPQLVAGDSPLCFPVRERDRSQRAHWFEWGWQHALDVHSWPALPDAVIEQQLSGYRHWQTVLCFPIPMNMDPNTLRQQLDL